MMISPPLIAHLEKVLARIFGTTFHVFQISLVSGGCINHAHKLETSAGNFFLKFNSKLRFPGMFEAEAKGLKLLKSTGTINVPEVICTGEFEALSFILLEYIESGKHSSDHWERAGHQLAKLHKKCETNFGLDHSNYIGSLGQSNTWHEEWISFFMKERILAIGSKIVEPYRDKLEKKLYDIFPEEPPALLHGDLWSGNIMCEHNGHPVFFDPAVYYGHREMDLAMTKLFGGFPGQFYTAYDREYPLAAGFDERVDFYNLYPLLVHVKLFGGSYLDRVLTILKRL